MCIGLETTRCHLRRAGLGAHAGFSQLPAAPPVPPNPSHEDTRSRPRSPGLACSLLAGSGISVLRTQLDPKRAGERQGWGSSGNHAEDPQGKRHREGVRNVPPAWAPPGHSAPRLQRGGDEDRT